MIIFKGNRFETVGDLVVEEYFKADCKLNEEDKKTLRNVAMLINMLADENVNGEDFKKLFMYAKKLEKRIAVMEYPIFKTWKEEGYDVELGD